MPIVAMFLLCFAVPLAAQDSAEIRVEVPPAEVVVNDNDTLTVDITANIDVTDECGGCEVNAQALVQRGWTDTLRDNWIWAIGAGFGLWQIKRWVDKWEPASTVVNSVVENGDVTVKGDQHDIDVVVEDN